VADGGGISRLFAPDRLRQPHREFAGRRRHGPASTDHPPVPAPAPAYPATTGSGDNSPRPGEYKWGLLPEPGPAGSGTAEGDLYPKLAGCADAAAGCRAADLSLLDWLNDYRWPAVASSASRCLAPPARCGSSTPSTCDDAPGGRQLSGNRELQLRGFSAIVVGSGCSPRRRTSPRSKASRWPTDSAARYAACRRDGLKRRAWTSPRTAYARSRCRPTTALPVRRRASARTLRRVDRRFGVLADRDPVRLDECVLMVVGDQ
jgi:hypothetical protein